MIENPKSLTKRNEKETDNTCSLIENLRRNKKKLNFVDGLRKRWKWHVRCSCKDTTVGSK